MCCPGTDSLGQRYDGFQEKEEKANKPNKNPSMQTFDSKILPCFEISLVNNISHFFLREMIPTESFILDTTASGEEERDRNELCCSC